MNYLRILADFRSVFSLIFVVFCLIHCTNGWSPIYTVDGHSDSFRPFIVPLERQKRDVAPTVLTNTTLAASSAASPAAPSAASPAASPSASPANVTVISNKTTQTADKPSMITPAVAVVTQIPLLGVNGSGILHNNVTSNTPKVSDPIMPDDNLTSVFNETPEKIQVEHNLANVTIDKHDFYNSTFFGDLKYFNQYWANISKSNPQIHSVLSNSHRRATAIQLTFPFPFYGQNITNITVATGGFIYTGDHVHNWLAATQYIAPLMANFDTTLTNDSVVKLYDDGEKFTAFWENVTLQEDVNMKFTFAVTLYKNGDIIFAYKNIPKNISSINDADHPVKVGISDAYLKDKIIFNVRHKTIYEYHRVSFKNYVITNNTILKLTALPTCLQYDSCDSCLNHNTAFNCTWCPQIQKCSSGIDRNKQDWAIRQCTHYAILNASMCPVKPETKEKDSSTAYVTDQKSKGADTEVENLPTEKTESTSITPPVSSESKLPPTERSSIGGVVVAFVTITLICCLGAWILYAFKNPHTRSGQMLIKYRPSQWNWRRGEARYTAATIHM